MPNIIRYDKFYKEYEELSESDFSSAKILKLADNLPNNDFIAWRLIIPKSGVVKYFSFASSSVSISDLEWIAEKKAVFSKPANYDEISNVQFDDEWKLYEISYPIVKFLDSDEKKNFGTWPLKFSGGFDELIKALRIEGALLQFAIGKAQDSEKSRLKSRVSIKWDNYSINSNEYIGSPARVKAYLALPGKPSIRLQAIINDYTDGASIYYVRNLNKFVLSQITNNPLLNYNVIPSFAAKVLAMEPIVSEKSVLGLELCKRGVEDYPLSHTEPIDSKAIAIGKAISTSGVKRIVKLPEIDLKKHWHIVGQTGAGKSTLLANSLASAIEKGYGLTFFDPHGTTIDVLLNMVSKEDAKKVRVIRFGDYDNPVHLDVWGTDNPDKIDRIIADLSDMFVELFDEGHLVAGPRWERWFFTFAKAAVSLLGKRASFENIITLSQNRDNMKNIAEALRYRNPDLKDTILLEYCNDRSPDFEHFINWAICKLTRLVSSREVKQVFGTGADSLQLEKAVDDNLVTLIDLAQFKLGVRSSRMLGTIVLMQLWRILSLRKNRNDTHIVAIDEAHLFQHNPLPQMLAESRKFGVSLIIANQHLGQFNSNIRDSLDANTANFTAFRLSVRDAHMVSEKFEDNLIIKNLSRLNSFKAISTISVNGLQSEDFTLSIEKPKYKKNSSVIFKEILKSSRLNIVEKYRNFKNINKDDLLYILETRNIDYLNPYIEGYSQKVKVPFHDKLLTGYLHQIRDAFYINQDIKRTFFEEIRFEMLHRFEKKYKIQLFSLSFDTWAMIFEVDEYRLELSEILEKIKEEIVICKDWLLHQNLETPIEKNSFLNRWLNKRTEILNNGR